MDPPVEPVHDPLEEASEALPVEVVVEDRDPAGAPGGDVEDAVLGEICSGDPWHVERP
jgi:hypothetical protein